MCPFNVHIKYELRNEYSMFVRNKSVKPEGSFHVFTCLPVTLTCLCASVRCFSATFRCHRQAEACPIRLLTTGKCIKKFNLHLMSTIGYCGNASRCVTRCVWLTRLTTAIFGLDSDLIFVAGGFTGCCFRGNRCCSVHTNSEGSK